ncbi:YCF48-related protein [Pseudomonas sp. GD03858]|uniref:WD40/YVTN/BNR-like repeat-containing protein n=1 Tax=unclassified Pseudomonas TaxID=196821 RepID=UPI00244B74FB|nr:MULTISPECIES: YCF48-related protein [unclassified Pseudomonas]MDH0646957.1 YCF48-related protein [Pseudomonas sp. GD03867]MDH0662700.1 YCF48-related protein [Pseudomonas sp. GD03858]
MKTVRVLPWVIGLMCAGQVWAAPAIALSEVRQAPLVAVARAGQGLVAVGDHGVVAVSADGKQWQQARSVPVDGLLTSVSFIDDRRGWAVGHGGVLLRSIDGGQNWVLQHTLEGKPVLLSVLFVDARHGVVVGAYGYAARTADGGASWQAMQVGEKGDDFHLNQVFRGGDGSLFIAGEAGHAYRSTDQGASWQPLDTGVTGSLWTGTGLRDGRVLLAGMSGRVLLGDPQGRHWQVLDSGSREAITALTQLDDGRVALVGNAGLMAVSDSQVAHFTSRQREDRLNLAALAAQAGHLLLFGAAGVVLSMAPDAKATVTARQSCEHAPR